LIGKDKQQFDWDDVRRGGALGSGLSPLNFFLFKRLESDVFALPAKSSLSNIHV